MAAFSFCKTREVGYNGRMEETEEKINDESKAKALFWILFALWTIFALIAPVAWIIWRYQLFQPKTEYQFGGWGFIAVVIIAVFALTCFRYVCKGFPRWSMAKQCIKGLCIITIPCLALYFALSCVASNIELFLQSLAFVTASETVAIPLNPFPKWVDKQTQGQYDGAIDYLFKKYDEHKEGRK